MTFVEKLRAIVGERGRTTLDAKAGLPRNTISGLINQGYTPGLEKAAKIARAVGVSLDWLADEGRGMPPAKAVYEQALSLLAPDAAEAFEAISSHYADRAAVLAAAIDVFAHAGRDQQVLAITHAIMKRDGKGEKELSRLRAPVDPSTTLLGIVRPPKAKKK